MAHSEERKIEQYDAFVSYSRKDVDFASEVERTLEGYSPPRDLKAPSRHLNIFRDEGDLTGSEYFQAIDIHLRNSTKLIVLCSPNARNSDYVNDEIRRFAKIKGAENILPVIIAGTPNNEVESGQESDMAFPEVLCQIKRVPLAADYREFVLGKDKINKGGYESSWFMLLANIYGVSRSEIEQRDRNRQRRRRKIAGGAILGVLVAFMILAVWALWERQIANNQWQIALSRMLALEALQEDDYDLSIRLSLEAFRVRDTVEGRRSLLEKVALAKGYKDFSYLNLTEAPPTALAFTEDGKGLFTGDAKGKLLRWDLDTKKSSSFCEPFKGKVLHIRTTERGKRLVVVATRQISIFDFDITPPKQETLDLPNGEISSAGLSADGILLAIGNRKGTIVVMNLRENKISASMADPDRTEAVISLSFHPTEPVLAASYNIDPVDGFEQPIVLWDAIKGSRLDPPFVGHRFEVTSLSFSPDGKQLASGSWDLDVRLWDTVTRKMIPPVLVKAAHGEVRTEKGIGPTQVAIRPDGEMLVSVRLPYNISFWDMTSHKSLGLIEGLIKGTTLAFSPKGKLAAIGGEDKNILLIPTDFKYWLREACRLTSRSLSDQEKRYYIGETGGRLILAVDPCADIK